MASTNNNVDVKVQTIVIRPITPTPRSRSHDLLDLLLRYIYPAASIADIKNPVFWRDVVVETVLCMYVECLVIWALSTLEPAMYKPSTTHFGLWAGFLIYLLIEGYGPISGCPINPAGCWGFFLAGRMSAARAFFYTIGEVGGASAGAMIAYSLTPDDIKANIPVLGPGPGLHAWQGCIIEGILTFNLLFVALSVTNPRGKIAIMPSFPIAFCIGTGIMAAGTHTGGLQNPIVPLGPAVCRQNFNNHWIYWVGPYVGATVGSVFYQFVCFFKDFVEHHQQHADETIGTHNPAHDDSEPQ